MSPKRIALIFVIGITAFTVLFISNKILTNKSFDTSSRAYVKKTLSRFAPKKATTTPTSASCTPADSWGTTGTLSVGGLAIDDNNNLFMIGTNGTSKSPILKYSCDINTGMCNHTFTAGWGVASGVIGSDPRSIDISSTYYSSGAPGNVLKVYHAEYGSSGSGGNPGTRTDSNVQSSELVLDGANVGIINNTLKIVLEDNTANYLDANTVSVSEDIARNHNSNILYIVDTNRGYDYSTGNPKYHHRIMSYNLNTNTLGASFGTFGTANGQLGWPVGIAVDPRNGDLWVVDGEQGNTTGNTRIQKFSSSGTWQLTVGKAAGAVGTGTGEFNQPKGVSVDNSGNVFVADFGNNRIQIFNELGSYIGQINSSGIKEIAVKSKTNGDTFIVSSNGSTTSTYSCSFTSSTPTPTATATPTATITPTSTVTPSPTPTPSIDPVSDCTNQPTGTSCIWCPPACTPDPKTGKCFQIMAPCTWAGKACFNNSCVDESTIPTPTPAAKTKPGLKVQPGIDVPIN